MVPCLKIPYTKNAFFPTSRSCLCLPVRAGCNEEDQRKLKTAPDILHGSRQPKALPLCSRGGKARRGSRELAGLVPASCPRSQTPLALQEASADSRSRSWKEDKPVPESTPWPWNTRLLHGGAPSPPASHGPAEPLWDTTHRPFSFSLPF